MIEKKKVAIVIMICASIVMVSLLFNNYTNHKDRAFNPGTYEATVQGHNTAIDLSVKLDENRILSIDIVNHSETSGISDPAIEQIPKRIVDRQTLAVDTIASCTITSAAILSGVEKALEDAGADISLFKVKDEVFTAKSEITKTADVIVIGGGLAGLSAATTVAESGGKVIVIEKMENLGGNSMRSGGTFNAVDPDRQKAQGIVDSVELYIKNTYESGGKKGNLDLIRVLCENARDARYWISEHGGEWQEKVYLAIGGVWPRSLDAKSNGRDTLIKPLEKAILSKGGEVIVNCRAKEIIINNGRVVGVKAYDTLDGKEYTFMAQKGVVLATGGFSANSEMVSKYNDKIPENNPTTNSPCATGDGIVMAEDIGANLVHMGYIQLHPNSGTNVYFTGMIDNSIYVNQKGKRFVNEQQDRSEVCNAILEQPGGVIYAIFDSNTVNDKFWSTQDGYQDYIALAKEGKCGYGETIEELAASIGVDKKNLKETIGEFNKAVDGLVEDPYGRELFFKKISDGPFYASIRTARTHNTLGGVQIDTKARVINKDGRIIPGLVACGEVTGGIHGENRLGGNSLTDCVVFGRIAGKTLMEN